MCFSIPCRDSARDFDDDDSDFDLTEEELAKKFEAKMEAYERKLKEEEEAAARMLSFVGVALQHHAFLQ